MSMFTIADIQKIAQARGGRCLSRKLTGAVSQTRLQFCCVEGHKWEARADHIINGTWCPCCAKRPQDIEQRLQKVAQERGGKFLSAKYVNQHTKLEWQCKHGHRWWATASAILYSKNWCPYCCGKNQDIKDLIALAHERAGKLLSTKYRGAHAKHQWQCIKGHKWYSTPSSVRYGTWCPICANEQRGLKRRLKSLKKLQTIVKQKGGKCLSSVAEFESHKSSVKLECEHGHQWQANPNNVINQGCWCPQCYMPKNKHTLEEMQQLAQKHKGECLSCEYLSLDKKLLWRCYEGHEFKLSASAVLHKGSWCRTCARQSLSLNEAMNLAREKGGECLSQQVTSLASLLRWQCQQGHQWRANYLSAKDRWCCECKAIAQQLKLAA